MVSTSVSRCFTSCPSRSLFHLSNHSHCHTWVMSGSLSSFCPISMEPMESLSHSCTSQVPWVEPGVGLMQDGSHSSPVSLTLQRPASPAPVCWLFSLMHWTLRVLPNKFLILWLLRTSLLGHNCVFFPRRTDRKVSDPKLFDSVAQHMAEKRSLDWCTSSKANAGPQKTS